MNKGKPTYFYPTLRWVCLLLTLSLYHLNLYGLKPPASPHTLFFTENKGQWNKKFIFMAEIGQGVMFIEKNAFQYYLVDQTELAKAVKHPTDFWESLKPKSIHAHAMRVSFQNTNEDAYPIHEQALPFYYNYFLGNDASKWASEVKSYPSFQIQQLYKGINLQVTATKNGPIKYDLLVKPNINPKIIQLKYEGAEKISIKSGYLYIKTSVSTLVEKEPYAYQQINGAIQRVDCKYILSDSNSIAFELGDYNKNYELVIDPELIFSTYSGSTADNFGATATYDSEGNLFAAGITQSISTGTYPTTQGAFQMFSSGGVVGSWPQNGWACDITISKYNNDGSALLYATYLGGTLNDYAHSLVVDKNDNLILLGSTLSTNFPVTFGAYDVTHNDSFDIVVTKISKDGTSLVGSTYIGGSHSDGLSLPDTLCMGYMDHMRGEVIVDKNNDILVGSVTSSLNFPVTFGALQTIKKGAQDGCVFKLDSTLRVLKWATYLGDTFNETLNAIDVDALGNVYAVGGTHSKRTSIVGPVYDSLYHGGYADAYIAKINSTGTLLQRFKYWGGSDYDQSFFVKVHTNGDVYVLSQNFDTIHITPGVYSTPKGTINIAAFSRNLDSLRFVTRIGNGTNKNVLIPSAFMVDYCGNVYASVWGGIMNVQVQTGTKLVGAQSNTNNLPLTPDAIQSFTDGRDFYLFELSAGLTGLLYGTYVGEFSSDDHVDGGTSRFDNRGIIYQSFCASCNSGTMGDFPTTLGSYSPTNLSPRCSNASMKLDFRKNNMVIADFSINPRKTCTDSVVQFINNSYHGVRFKWYINGVLKDSSYHYADTFHTKGINTVKLVVLDSLRCNIIDSLTKTFEVQTSAHAKFVLARDTCSPYVFFKNLSTVDNNESVPYLWEFGDGDTSTVFNPTHLYQQNGNYTIKLTMNPNSYCYDTAVQIINYDSASHILEASIHPFDTLGCEPAQIHITNTSKNGQYYYWYINNQLAATTKNFDSTMHKGDFNFKLIVIDSATCIKTDSASTRVYLYPDVIPDFSVQRDSCSLTLAFTNLSNTAPGDSVIYAWFFGDGDSSYVTNPVHTFPSPGWYKIQLFTNPRLLCVKQKDLWYYMDNNKNVLQAQFTTTPPIGCRPANILFENTSINGAKFYWFVNNILRDSAINFSYTFDTIGTKNIRLIAIDSASCFKSDTAYSSLIINPYAKPKFIVQRDTCSPIVHFVNQTDTINPDPIKYTWSFGDGDTANTYHANHTYDRNGTYEVTLTTNPSTPCADTAKFNFTYDSISHLLTANFALNDSVLCLPAIVTALNTSISSKSNAWYLNNVFKTSNVNYIDTLLTEGTYTIKLVTKNPQACITSDSLEKQVIVNPASHTSFTILRDSCSLLVKFNNTSTGGNSNSTWLWDFGDGDTSNEKSPTHQYKKTDFYTIRLIADAGKYCSDTATQTWLIDGDTLQEVVIPNVFTPNGDLLNDCFIVKGISPKCDQYHIWIRNRWGNLFFESTDPIKCWNGKNEAGIEASEGEYIYIIKIKKQSGFVIDKAGTVTLLRD